MTGENSKTLHDAQYKCKAKSAKLPIIKSESENRFILGLMSNGKAWAWLGMKREWGKMVWFDNTPAEPLGGALYSAWNANEPSSQPSESCAYINFHERGWNNNICYYSSSAGPFVLCQKKRKKYGFSQTEG